jgi:hypothetical protein
LSPSVKAGGYGTAGWSIGGDIIIDVSKLIEVDIEVPKDDGSFTSLRDVAPANSKGKKSQGASSGINSGKRRREDDANLRVYDSASYTVASFLRDPSFPAQVTSTDAFNGLSPSILEGPESPDALSHTSSLTQDSFASSNSGFNSREQSISTFGTTPSPPPEADANISTSFTAVRPGNTNGSSNVTVARPGSSNGSVNSNPFAYLETPINFPPAPPPISLQSHYNPSVTTSWSSSSGHGSGFAASPFGQIQIPAQAEPIHPHAYVTFGAGMRQKEIDIFTAQHKLEARYITGDGDGIPYHVPL